MTFPHVWCYPKFKFLGALMNTCFYSSVFWPERAVQAVVLKRATHWPLNWSECRCKISNLHSVMFWWTKRGFSKFCSRVPKLGMKPYVTKI